MEFEIRVIIFDASINLAILLKKEKIKKKEIEVN